MKTCMPRKSSEKTLFQKTLLKISVLSAGITGLAVSSALAHPGHGIDHDHPWSVLHYLGSPQHALLIVAGLALAGYVVFRTLKSRRKSASKNKQA